MKTKLFLLLIVIATSLVISGYGFSEDDVYYARCNLKVIKGNRMTWVNWQSTRTVVPVGTKFHISKGGKNSAKHAHMLIDTARTFAKTTGDALIEIIDIEKKGFNLSKGLGIIKPDMIVKEGDVLKVVEVKSWASMYKSTAVVPDMTKAFNNAIGQYFHEGSQLFKQLLLFNGALKGNGQTYGLKYVLPKACKKYTFDNSPAGKDSVIEKMLDGVKKNKAYFAQIEGKPELLTDPDALDVYIKELRSMLKNENVITFLD